MERKQERANVTIPAHEEEIRGEGEAASLKLLRCEVVKTHISM